MSAWRKLSQLNLGFNFFFFKKIQDTFFKIFNGNWFWAAIDIQQITEHGVKDPIFILPWTIITPKYKMFYVLVLSTWNDFCKCTGYIFCILTQDSFVPGTIPLVLENFLKGAKVSWKVTNLFMKTAVFTPGILGSMITFCLSTEKYAFQGVDSSSASSLYNFL